MPRVTGAVARELRIVRVTCDAPLPDVTAGAHGALNPALWTFTGYPGVTDPVAPVGAARVDLVSSSVFDVISDDDLSPAGTYQIAARSASDGGIDGMNVTPENAAIVQAFVPPQPPGRDFSFLRFLPRMNLLEDTSGDLERVLKVFDDVLKLHLDRIDRWTDILDLDKAPENFVDLLLQDFGNPFAFTLSEIDKRRLARSLVSMYREKGTGVGIRNAIRFFLGYESDVLWTGILGVYWQLGISHLGVDTILGATNFNPSLHGTDVGSIFAITTTVYDFFLKVGKTSALTADELARVNAIVDFMKPSHTHPKGVLTGMAPPAGVRATSGLGQITVSWNAAAGASGYAIFRSPTPIISSIAPSGTVVGAGQTSFVDIVGSGDQRFYVVCARDGSGNNGVQSPIVSATAG